MRRLILTLAAIAAVLGGGAAAAARTDWSQAARLTVTLSSFDFTPSTIRLRAGAPIVLRLVNSGSGGHNFAAPAFFAASLIDPASAPSVRRGAVELRGRQSVELRLVPAAGRYRLRCTHFLHPALGMTGEIVVE
jgi:plastocyanin